MEVGRVGRGLYQEEHVTNAARAELKRLSQKEASLFTALGYYRPHLPYVASEDFWNLYDRESIELPEWDKPPVGLPPVAFWSWLELRLPCHRFQSHEHRFIGIKNKKIKNYP